MKKTLTPLQKIINNLKNLVPYIGVLLVVAGVIGLLFIQKPLQETQDVRSDASEIAAIIKSCNESCSTNADCAINLRCYQGACRLAKNPTSPTCGIPTKGTTEPVTAPVKETTLPDTTIEDASAPAEIQEEDTTLKGDDLIPNTDTDFQPIDDAQAERKIYDDSYAADETILGLVKNLITNSESKLPIFIILLGILLLLTSVIFFLISGIKKRNANRITKHERENLKNINLETHAVKPGETPFRTPKSTPNPAAKNLLKNLEEEQKN